MHLIDRFDSVALAFQEFANSVTVFGGVRLTDDPRMMAVQKSFGSLKCLDLGALHIAFDPVGHRCISYKVVKRHAARCHATCAVDSRREPAPRAIGRTKRPGHEIQFAACRPPPRLDNGHILEVVSCNILAQTPGIFPIRLKAENLTLLAHQSGCEQCEQSDVRAEIEKDDSRTQTLGDDSLHLGFISTANEPFRNARVDPKPQAPRRPRFDLCPHLLVVWQHSMTQAMYKPTQNRNLSNRADPRRSVK